MIQFPTLAAFRAATAPIREGPVAILLAEDETEIASTLDHLTDRGFARIVLFAPDRFELPRVSADMIRVAWQPAGRAAMVEAVNTVIAKGPGLWMHYCFNAEYLFYPFCETRSVGELLAFHTEERRDAMLSYVVDLYADDTDAFPDAVSRDRAHLDRSGYYALARPDPDNRNYAMERQLNFYGGLRWRFEEHVPADSRRIDRIGLFRAKPGLKLREDHTFNDPEYNTYACPWHHNLTAAICSFRAAKALRRNAGSRRDVTTFTWHNSAPFEWSSEQLLDLGLMEPGQWF